MNIIGKLQRVCDRAMNYIARHMVDLAALGFLSLFASWHIGFYLNGLYGYRFELNSVWQGISTLMGAGVFGSIKYIADSWLNSARGEKVYKEEGAETHERNDIR